MITVLCLKNTIKFRSALDNNVVSTDTVSGTIAIMAGSCALFKVMSGGGGGGNVFSLFISNCIQQVMENGKKCHRTYHSRAQLLEHLRAHHGIHPNCKVQLL